MGASRAWAPHRRWTDVEESVLREQYATARLDELEALLPGRSRRMIQCKANGMGLVRQRERHVNSGARNLCNSRFPTAKQRRLTAR